MNKKWKTAIIAAAALLLVGLIAFAQAGASPNTGTQGFGPDENVWRGGPGGNYGNGGGFSCH